MVVLGFVPLPDLLKSAGFSALCSHATGALNECCHCLHYALMMKIIMYRALIFARSEDMMGRKARMREDVFSCSQLIHRAFYVLQDTL
jgi:hypothetical protein